MANKYLESFEKVLSYWISLKDCFYLKNGANNDFYLNLTIKKYSYEIFKSFIESRFLLETQTGLNKVNFSCYFLNKLILNFYTIKNRK